jgi:hypothetical protein
MICRLTIVATLAAAVVSSAAAAQLAHGPESFVTIEGCVRGGAAGKSGIIQVPYGEWRSVDVPAESIGRVDFELQGSSTLLKSLRAEYWGHMVEISGVGQFPPEPDAPPVTPPESGRIPPPRPNPARQSASIGRVTLKVERLRDLRSTCSAREINER